MKIKHQKDPIVFQSAVADFLVRYEAENNLPLGILSGLIAGEYSDKEAYMGVIEEEGKPILAALCTPPHPGILSYQVPSPPQEAIKLLLEDMTLFLGKDFTGINGEKSLTGKMKDIWEEETGGKAEIHTAMRIYKLEEVIPPRDTAGSIRPIKKKDRRLMMDWFEGFYRDIELESPDPTRVRKQVDLYLGAELETRGLMIWEKNGIPVSMAGYSGPTPNGIRIGAVYTPPEQRKRGYASAVTAGLSQQLLGMGFKFCFLFTDLSNPTSNHIYQQIGYKPVCDVDRYDFTKR